MTQTNLDKIVFDYDRKDSELFNSTQHEHWRNIEDFYSKLQGRCLLEVKLPQTGAPKGWVVSRVNLHVSQVLMRLLYLTETFCDSSKKFNATSSAAMIKAMTEVPLHLGYIVWVLKNHNDLESTQVELGKIAFGNRDPKSGFTTSSKVTQKVFYTRADEMVKSIFKKAPSTIDIFERLYKDANAIGHNNYEARMLTGIQDGDTWRAGDRKELFVIFSNSMFPLFFYCDTILSMSHVFLQVIDHHAKYLPTDWPK